MSACGAGLAATKIHKKSTDAPQGVKIVIFVAVKRFLTLLGGLALTLGIIGIFVPLLPTTPFLLLAAALWFRASPRCYAWLLAHPRLGPYVRQFREYRAIPLRAKIVSLTLLWATLLYCIFAVVDAWWWAQAGLGLLGAGITWHILSFATLRRTPGPDSRETTATSGNLRRGNARPAKSETRRARR